MDLSSIGGKSYEEFIVEEIKKQREKDLLIKKKREEEKLFKEKLNEQYIDNIKSRVASILLNDSLINDVNTEFENRGTIFGFRISKGLITNENLLFDFIEDKKKVSYRLGNFLLETNLKYIKKYFENASDSKLTEFKYFIVFAEDFLLINLMVKKDFYGLLDDRFKKVFKEFASPYVSNFITEINSTTLNSSEHNKRRKILQKKEA